MTWREGWRLVRPAFLALGTLCYAVGAGVARYLGGYPHLGRLALGWFVVMAVLAGAALAAEALEVPLPGKAPRAAGNLPPTRRRLLLSAGGALWVAAALALVVLRWNGAPWLSLWLAVVLSALAALYLAPRWQVAASGYGEWLIALGLAGLVPAFAFVLQQGEAHRLLGWLAFPLALLTLATLIVWEFPTYAADQRRGRRNLLQRLDWQRALMVHHACVATAFFALALALLGGLPWRIGAPVFLAAPVAAGQVWMLQRIAQGAKPLWKELTRLAWVTLALTCYLLALGFWLA